MKLSFIFQDIDTYTKQEAAMNTYQWLKNMKARNVRIECCVVKCNASDSLTDKIYETIKLHGEFRGVLSMIENGEETWHAPCHVEDDMEFAWEDGTVYLQVKVKDQHAYTQDLIAWMTQHSGIPYDQVDHIFFFQFENQDAINAATKYLPNQDFFSNIVSLSNVQEDVPSDIDSRDYPIRSEDDDKEYHEYYEVYAEHADNTPVESPENDIVALSCYWHTLVNDWDNYTCHEVLNSRGYPVTRRLTDTHITFYFWHNQKIVKKLEFARVVSSENAFQQ